MATTTLLPELPVYTRLPLTIVSGHGARLRTDDGRELVDFYGGHAVTTLGYAHPALSTALAAQVQTLHFQTNAVSHAGRNDVIARLVAKAPAGIERAFLVNSGAEANENALRLAFLRAQRAGEARTTVVTVAGAFHGRTAAASACGPGTGAPWYAFPRAPFDVVTVPFDDSAALRAAVDDTTAAVILEPVQGVAGARDMDLDFIRAARVACDAHGAVFIADEVQCGMGRCGTMFAVEAAGVRPDILTSAKGLAGGFPAGAVLTTEAFADLVRPGDLGTTYGAAPLACAAIGVVLDHIDDACLARVNGLSVRIRAALSKGATPTVTSVHGRGLLLGLVTAPPAAAVRNALLERGVLVGTSADPHIVRLTPPLLVTDADVDVLLDALREIDP